MLYNINSKYKKKKKYYCQKYHIFKYKFKTKLFNDLILGILKLVQKFKNVTDTFTTTC